MICYYRFKCCKLSVYTRICFFFPFWFERISYLCLQLINVIAVNGKIMVLRVIGEFFAVIEICRIAIRAPVAHVSEPVTVVIICKCSCCGMNALNYQVRTVEPISDAGILHRLL